jgi:hypothetical protein
MAPIYRHLRPRKKGFKISEKRGDETFRARDGFFSSQFLNHVPSVFARAVHNSDKTYPQLDGFLASIISLQVSAYSQ